MKKIVQNFYNYGSQKYLIIEHLNYKGSITQVEAETVYKIRRLSARISEINADYSLGKNGSYITTITRSMKKDMMGQKYARYSYAK